MDEQERVEYSFTGDVDSLRDATKEAISLLDQYESTVKSLVASNKLEVGKTAFTGFQRTVNGVIKQVNTLSKYIDKAAAESKGAFAPDVPAVTSAYSAISDALQYLQSGLDLTSDDIKLLTGVLQEARSTLDPVVGQVQALGSSFAKVAPAAEQAMSNVESTIERTEKNIESHVDSVGQQWDDYANRMSKSAEMSAQVFAKEGKFTGFLTGVDNAVAKAVLMRSRVEESINGIVSKIKTMSSAFDPATSKLVSYKDKAASILGLVQKALDSVSAAFRRTAQSTESSESKTARSTEKLGEKASKATGRMNMFRNSMANATRAANGLHKALTRITAIQIGRWLSKAVTESINYVENLNLFNVAMGNSIDKGMEFVNTMSEVYGMDPSNLYKYAGYFYQLTDAIGMADDASAVLSLSLTRASNDIASLFNVDVKSVVDDLASGMQGMSRAVRKYGMDIRATTLQQTALSYGITEQVESMSEANRMALRYLTMLKQVKNATSQTVEEIDGSTGVIGDFARNIETPANQLRIFKEQITQLGRAIGNFFMPMLRTVLPVINGVVMSLRTALTAIASMLGITEQLSSNLSSSSDSVEDLGSAVNKTAKEIKKILAPFDELNILSKQSAGESGLNADDVLDPALQDAIENMELSLDKVTMKANKVRDAILSFFGFQTVEILNVDTGKWEETVQWSAEVFKTNLIDKFPKWAETIDALFSNWSSIMSSLRGLWESIGSVVAAVFGKIKNLLGGLSIDTAVAEGISNLASSLEGLSSWIQENSDSIADLILLVSGLFVAFKSLSAIGSIAGAASTLSSNISGFGKTIPAVAGAVAVIAALYTNSEAFATAFNSLLQTFWTSMKPIAESVVALFTIIWQSMQTLWTTYVQPMIQQTGEALAPVLATIGSLWSNVSVIFTNVATMLSQVWTSTIEPVIAALMTAISGVMEIFQTLWETVLGPIIGYIGDGLQNLWTQYLSPVVSNIMEIVGGLIELLLNLWNTVLQPLVEFVVNLFGPTFAAAFQFIWTIVEQVVGFIGAAISVLTGALSGIIEFLNGVFTGDWKRALSGLANLFVALGNGIIGVVESVCNFGVGAINSFLSLIVGAVKGVINGVGGLIEGIAKMLGFNVKLQVNWTAPQIPRVSLPRIPKVALAQGGVVTGPTQALIGEGKYDEAVIPLGDSPQMQELVDRVANARNESDDSDLVPVQLFLDGDIFYEAMARRARAARLRNGFSTF